MPNAVNSWYAFGSAKSRQLNISRRSMSKMANGQYRGPYKLEVRVRCENVSYWYVGSGLGFPKGQDLGLELGLRLGQVGVVKVNTERRS